MRFHVLLSILTLVVTSRATAQQSNMATDYWCSFLPSVDNIAPAWLLVNTYTAGTQVKVIYSDDTTTVDQFKVEPNKPVEYRIRINQSGDRYLMAKPDQPDVPQRRSVHVISTAPIMLQQFSDADNNVGLAMPIPTAFLGKQYVIAAFNDQHPYRADDGGFGGWTTAVFPQTGGGFIVIAPEDSTFVTITAAAKFEGGLLPGQSKTLRLDRGQTLWMRGLADSSSNDISGTRVSSSKPVSITAGAEIARTLDALVLQDHFDYNDYIADYMLPVEQWGTEYIGTPLTNKRGTKEDDLWGEFYRVFAVEPTELFVNGESRGLGNYWEFRLATIPMHFTAEKPIMVVQYDYYIDFHGINPKNPRTSNSMMVLIPRHQWVKSAAFTVPTGYAQTYVYVTAHKDSMHLLQVIDAAGQSVALSGFAFSQAQKYVFGQYRTHTFMLDRRGQITIAGPCQFQVYNHGTRDNDQIKATYGYASMVASTFGRLESTNLRVDLDSTCGAFDLTITDTNANGAGIADVTLMINGMKYNSLSYSSENTKLTIEPHDIEAKQLQGRVSIRDPFQNAVAYLQIRSRSGWDRLIALRFISTSIGAVEKIDFPISRMGEQPCKTAQLVNTDSRPITIDTLLLLRDSSSFTLSFSKPFPITLDPDEVFEYEVCYSPVDTGVTDWDSVVIVTECMSANRTHIEGRAYVAQIFANDHNYDVVVVGETEAYDIEVANKSPYLSLTLTGAELESDEFSIDPTELSRFPITLAPYPGPGNTTKIRTFYAPLDEGSDTATIIWLTDIHPDYKERNIKHWSMLFGRGRPKQAVSSNSAQPSIFIRDGVLSVSLLEGERTMKVTATDILGAEYPLSIHSPMLDALPAGLYFLTLETSMRTLRSKIVK